LPSDPPDAPCPGCGQDRERSPIDISTTGYRGPFSAPAPAELARHFPTLEILGLAGQGGMGAVYRARQTKLDRLVALKILPPAVGQDPSFAARFTREARTLARLSHPHVVAIHDFGEIDGLYYLLMEFVDGANLRQLLRAGRLPPEDALKIAAQVCDALQYAHEEGIVHRDVKPENILLDKKGRVKIADFGLAKLLLERSSVDHQLTASQQVMGTWHYMAPEQIEKPLQVDHRADIYSLGVVLYEILTGSLPLGRFPLPSEQAPVDARLDEVVLRALEKNPEQRYQRITEMKASLEAITAGGEAQPHPPVPPTLPALGALKGVLRGAAQPHPPVPPTDAAGTEVLPASRDAQPVPPTLEDHAPIQADAATVKAARRLVHTPAFGLVIAGWFATFMLPAMIVLVIMTDRGRFPGGLSSVLWATWIPVFLGVLVGSVLILGGRRMRALRSYELALFSSILAMLPLTVGWIFSLPLGIWAFRVLGRREVQAAFPLKMARANRSTRQGGRRRVERFLGSRSGWAMIVCVVGLLFCLVPWWQTGAMRVNGFSTWYGVLVMTTFLAVLALLVATGVIEPMPIWHPIALIAAGLGVELFMGLYFWHESAVLNTFASTRMAYVPLGCGLALLLLGTRQLRGVLMRQRPDAASRPGEKTDGPAPR
jgi:hypothetical protein